MKVSNILIAAALALGVGGVVTGAATGNGNNGDIQKLEDELSNLRSDMEAADASNKAELRAELVAMINETRDNLKAAYEAADATLMGGVTNLQNAINNALNGKDDDDEDDGIAEAIGIALSNQINTKVGGLKDAIDDLEDSLEEGFAEHQEAIELLEDAVNDLYDDLKLVAGAFVDVADGLQEIFDEIEALENAIAGYGETLDVLVASINALEAKVDGNYYTIAQVNSLLNGVNAAIATLTNLFKVNGSIVSMADLMAELSTKFAAYDAAIAAAQNGAEAQAALAGLNDAVAELNEKLDDFYGAAAKAAKANLVNKLTMYLVEFDNVINEAVAACEASYAAVDEAVPQFVYDAYAAVRASEGKELRALLNEGIAMIILAADVNEAIAVEAAYEAKMDSFLDYVAFAADKVSALADVDVLALNAEGAAYYAAAIENAAFTNDYAADKAALDLVVYGATKYKALADAADAANAALAQVAGLDADALAAFVDYNNGVAGVAGFGAGTANAADEAEIDAVCAAFAEKLDLVAAAAAVYAAKDAQDQDLDAFKAAFEAIFGNYADFDDALAAINNL